MEVETFLTELHVIVDDCYRAHIEGQIKKHAGAVAQLSDSEVITIAMAQQWRKGVPWSSERSIVKWMNEDGKKLFPKMIQRSAFNARGGGYGAHLS